MSDKEQLKKVRKHKDKMAKAIDAIADTALRRRLDSLLVIMTHSIIDWEENEEVGFLRSCPKRSVRHVVQVPVESMYGEESELFPNKDGDDATAEESEALEARLAELRS